MKKKTIALWVGITFSLLGIFLCACTEDEESVFKKGESENAQQNGSEFPLGENELPWISLD